MEAATSNLKHSYGLGPRGPNLKLGAEPPHGFHEAVPPLQGLPHPEEQHHKPFFYIQPQQPYLPMQSLQWPVPLPMPMSYNHYYGYPGLGYGLPMMPHYQPNLYMETPGFVVPHTSLHLMDYRRMLNPQYYQTMAYHSRRFRYQHNSSAKEMTSSEVQTEPLVLAHKSSTPNPNDSNMAPGVSTGQLLSSTLALRKDDRYPDLQDKVTSSTPTATPSNGSFVIQTEEVRIECCATPVGLQLLRAHETAEMSQSFSKDMVQCNSLLQSRVLQDERLHLPSDQSQQELQVCPDILLVGKPNAEEKILPVEEPRSQMDHVTAAFDLEPQKVACVKAKEALSDEDLGVISKNFHLKGIHLPFDSRYLDELRKMESTVWSAEDTLIPAPELLVQNNLVEPNDRLTSSEVMEQEVLEKNEEVPSRESVHVLEMLSEDELENMVSTVESIRNHMVSEAESCPVVNAPQSELTNLTEATLSPSLVALENPPLKTDDQQRLEANDEDHEDTSFESLPASLPSASWLSDFDIYYNNKMPQAPKRQSRPLSSCGSDIPKRRRKLDYKEQPSIRKPKERFKPKGKASQQSFSDHECCVGRNFNENFFSSYKSKTERLCSRCLSKRRICTSNCTSSSGCDDRSLKRKAVPFQPWNDALLPTCEACKSHTKMQQMSKGSNPDLCGPHHRHDTEGESSGNSSCRTSPKCRPAVNSMRPLASKQNIKLPAVIHPKLREKDCACDLQHQSVAWERLHHCSHGNANRGMDENCIVPGSLQNKWRNVDPMYLTHRWQTEKLWRDVMPNTHKGLKNEATSQDVINYKKTQPQSQGTRTKDTRC